MEKIDKLATSFLNEAEEDYVGLWAIAPTVRRDFALSDNQEVKARTLEVVRILLDHGLLAGDFDYDNSKIYFWDERDPQAIIARIDREWDPARGDPTLPESICWFAKARVQ
ncbi:MAG: hypothetical protein ABSC72_01610 [Methylovirgula sp.]|jgi:hypothetical protein